MAIVPVAGHTPGSQVVVVQLGGGAAVRRAFITGDVVNHMDGLRLDLPKPRLYGLLVVPESPERLAGVRRYLRGLMDEHGYTALVGHDRHQLASSGVPAWRARP